MFDDLVCLVCLIRALILLVIANGAPVLLDRLLKDRLTMPIDLGYTLDDGQPLFGSAKTWRGLLAAIGLTGLTAGLLNIELAIGIGFALLAMAGDLSSSFVKRRFGFSVSSRARVLDTVPESALPAVVLKETLGLSWVDVILIVLCFLFIEEFLSPLLYKLHIRKRPY